MEMVGMQKMDRPVEPKKEDCCNSGCNPCIFDVYEKQLIRYEQYLENGAIPHNPEVNGIAQLEYTAFKVVKKTNICKSHNLILFKRSNGKKVWWKPGDHFLLKYISNEKSCTRAYTPIVTKNESKSNYDFSIVVKKYDNGVVSNYLYGLDVGNIALWRGPYGHYDLQPSKFDRIIMIAQGTGIAPFISIIDNILSNEDDMTRIILLYCSKSSDTILFRNELYEYRAFWNFVYKICVSYILENEKLRYQEPIKHGKLSIEDLWDYKPFISKDQFLICGSQQFNENYDILLREQHQIENIVLF